MTAISFPNNPSSGDTHTAGNGIVYTYDGEKWTSIGTNSAGTWTRSGTEVSLTNAGDDLNVDSGTLFVDASTDRVGVGTSSPSELLDVNGDAHYAGSITSTVNNDYSFEVSDGTTNMGGFYRDNTGNNLFVKNNAGASKAYVLADGSAYFASNVGIGITSPATTLEVQNSTDPKIRIGDGIRHFEVHGGSATQNTGIGTDYNSGFNFFVNGESNVAATIDSSGRLLVGTSTARDDFYNQSSTYGPAFQVESSNVTTGGSMASVVAAGGNNFSSYLLLGKHRGSTGGTPTIVNDDDQIGSLSFQGGDGSEMVELASINAFVDGTPGANDMPGRLVFSTTADGASSPTERMRIANDGDTSVFVNDAFDVRTAGTSSTGAALHVRNGATSNTSGSVRLAIRQDGDVENTNNRYGALSDIKLKENIVDANSQWGDIKELRVRKFNFIGESSSQIGVIAQEVELTSPGLVKERNDYDEEGNDLGTTTKSVGYSVLYMKAVKALQEAMERIETLEAKVATLEAS